MFFKSRFNQEVIPAHIREALPAGDAFSHIMAMQGEIHRDMSSRRTIRVVLAGKSYFIKQHFGVGWREIFKNLLTLRLPIVSALTEWKAIQRLQQLGIATTQGVAYGCRGCSPASMRSFVMTEDIGDHVSLETLCADWLKNPPDARFKRRLIVVVAELARKLHGAGLNHRDFYICHLCLDRQRLQHGEIKLYLIDLHRVGIRSEIRESCRMKDIAALNFSAMDCGLSQRDRLRFLRHYRQQKLRRVFETEASFWANVFARSDQLYLKFHGTMPRR